MSEKTEWAAVPIFKGSWMEARDQDAIDLLRRSNQANAACAKAIEKAIDEKWDGIKLKAGSAVPIIEKFGIDRTMYVLANTLQLKKYDGRFSRDNMAWAQMVQIELTPREQPAERRYSWEIGSHPYKLDMFVKQTREEIEAISIRETPVYYEPIAYAMENEEMGPYWDSFRCNAACAKDVKEAIADHYDGYRLEKGAADAVIQKYGQERTFFVLANTIQLMRDDGRVSRDNIQWADTIPIPHGTPDDDSNRRHFMVREHPGLFDVFVKWTRREQEQKSRLPLAEQLKKAQRNAAPPAASAPRKKQEQAL